MEDKILNPEQREKFEARIERQDRWYARGQRLWGLAHYLALFVSIISSGMAALIPQLQGFNSDFQKNLTSILAGMAAVLISLSTAGGFGKKWRANRLSKSMIRKLRNELIGRASTAADIDRLNQIDEEHNTTITST
jgi:hypothetical protein